MKKKQKLPLFVYIKHLCNMEERKRVLKKLVIHQEEIFQEICQINHNVED